MGEFCAAILILKMEDDMQHFCHIMLCYFKKGKNATGLQEKMCAMYGEGAVTDRMCQKWFAKFLGTIDIFGQIILCCGTAFCFGRCLAATHGF